MILPVILSGGSGTRLWPLSRELYPKQLLPLVNSHTMLQETVLRLSGLGDIAEPLIVSNDHHRFMVAEQMRLISMKPSAIVLEPAGRNTAPAVAVAALHAIAGGADPILLVLPADHVIDDIQAFQDVVSAGAAFARSGRLITFGIVPQSPETGYGYIKTGSGVKLQRAESANKRTLKHPGKAGQSTIAYSVDRFEEKPDIRKARAFIKSGDYLWNSGMFMFRASVFLEELKRFAPAMLSACQKAYKASVQDLEFLRLDRKEFSACPADSIDYAVMEKTEKAVVIPLDAGWNDVGSWSALWEVLPKDGQGNALSGDVNVLDAANSLIYAGSRLVSVIGISDCVVVETSDAVLVSRRDQAQKVKQVVDQLKKEKRDEVLLHRRVNRPWGAYECIDSSERFQVKRITVNPGASLSLQKHMHRAEHWIVVKGTARITRDRKVVTLTENQSTYIPLGITHRLENPGRIPLELIEVQSGSYLGEDDIIRLDDHYGRSGRRGERRTVKRK